VDGPQVYRLQCVCGLLGEALSPASWSHPAFDACSGRPTDFFFHLPLWLTTPCLGHTLWAFNAEHLVAMEAYIAADHRQRKRIGGGWVNKSLLSRLPDWMIHAHARDDVLAGFRRLKEKLLGPS
jgi:hypothetical protein